MLCTVGDLDRIADALRGSSRKVRRFLIQAYSPKNDARLVRLTIIEIPSSLDTNDLVAEAGHSMDANMIWFSRVLDGARN